MQVSMVFSFDEAPAANRFLNDVNSHLSLEHTRARLFDRDKVRVAYNLKTGAYDDTLSLLDDLSSQYGGKAID